MSDALRLVGLNAGFAVLGAVALVSAGIPLRREWAPTLLGLAPLTGLALAGLAASLLAMVGIGIGIVATVALVLVAVLLFRRVAAARAPRLGSLRPSRHGTLSRILEGACLLLLGALAVRLLALAAASGLGWDGWAIWGVKAHALFVEGDVWGPVFAAPEYAMHHPEYPVLLPALEALSAEAVGGFDPNLIDVEASVLLVAFGLAIWGMLRLVTLPPVAAAAAVALSGSAPLIGNVAENYADAVVAAFVSVGLLCLLVWLLHGAYPAVIAAGVCLAAGSMTKNEGLVFALGGIVAALAVAHGFGRGRRPLLVLGAGVLALPAVWAVVDRLNGPGPQTFDASALLDPGYVFASDRIPLVASTMLDEIAEAWLLVVIAVALGILAAVCARLWWTLAFVAVWSGTAFGALVVVYVISTLPLDWHLATSADRVVFSVVLGLATLAPVLVSQAWARVVE